MKNRIKIKNRTVIGIICLILAIVTMFVVAPLVTKITTDSADVPRLKTGVGRGTEITAAMIEKVSVKKDTLPAGVITDERQIIGKFATSALYAGDYLTDAKLAGEANGAEDVFASLGGRKVAMSVTVDSFASGLSGKLENGDIVSLIIVSNTGTSVIPGALTYVRVITTTTAGGVDQDRIVRNDDGTYDMPTTVTLLLNTEQARLLAGYEDRYTIHFALVFRGDAETANRFTAVQDAWFENTDSTADEPEQNEPEHGGSGDGTVKRANDIINGRAGYFDVEKGIMIYEQ